MGKQTLQYITCQSHTPGITAKWATMPYMSQSLSKASKPNTSVAPTYYIRRGMKTRLRRVDLVTVINRATTVYRALLFKLMLCEFKT